MKKFLNSLMMAAVVSLALVGCNKEPDNPTPVDKGIGSFTLSEIADAAAAAYQKWENGDGFPETFQVGSKTLSLPEYQFAICKALVNINAGVKDAIEVFSYKPAEHPERDSYDKETIAIANGPKNGDETEDLVNVATRMLARMEADLTVPNQTNFTRNGSAIAFSTDRATIVISRVLAAYKSSGKLDASVSADYKGAAATLKAFAQQLVSYLDVWENTVGTVDADGSHCTANNSAWKNVHFIPIEYSGGYNDGEMYDQTKYPVHHITVDGREYTAAECWSVAAQGIMDLVTVEGSALMQPQRNPFVHTMGNGKSLSEPIPTPGEYATVTGWNKWPWYENTSDGDVKLLNFSETLPCTVEFVAHLLGWYLTRCTQFDPPAIGNYQQFGKGDSVINFGEYDGIISAMRTFLIMVRFYDYLLKNDINDNVWDAVKDIHLDYDLYGIDMPDIETKTTKIDYDWAESTKELSFSSKKAWTAEATESWITVEPASGEAGDITLKIKVAENLGDAREGKVILKGGNVTDGIEVVIAQVKYTAPSTATIKDFAEQYVTILNVWNTTVGDINRLSNSEPAKETDEDVVKNVHYIPNTTTITVGGKTYNTADMLETALRSYLLLRGWDGLETEKNGYGNIPTKDPVSMSETTVPQTHDYTWGTPLIESSNGGYLVRLVGNEEVHCVVDPTILDNWAQRSINFQHGKNITNLCGYPRDPITNYSGCFSSGRALITYAFFFKYMLDNNLDRADGIAPDQDIRSELFGDEEGSIIDEPVTIKDFATEYVKILDVWEKTTGTIDQLKGEDFAGGEWNVENAHYVPETTTITVGGKTYNTADMYETALRCYLLVRGYNGLDLEKYGKGSIAALDGGAVSMSTEVPETHGYVWGTSPYNETPGNGGHFVMGTKDNNEHCKVKLDALDNWAMRSLNYSKGNPITNLCGYSSGQLDGYYGCFCSKRALITYAFFFKYMLDNNLDKADAIAADTIFRTELFGDESAAPSAAVSPFKAEWLFSADTMAQYKDTFGGTAGVYDKNPGDGGMYVNSNVSEGGKLYYVQVDKTEIDVDNKSRRIIGGTGHPYVSGPWIGDYWLFVASNGKEQPAGAKVHIKYITRSSATGPKYWIAEYLDGTEWKPALELKTAEGVEHNVAMESDGSTNVQVEVTYTTTQPMTEMKFRMRCLSMLRADGKGDLTKPNGGTNRIAGAAETSPIFEVLE